MLERNKIQIWVEERFLRYSSSERLIILRGRVLQKHNQKFKIIYKNVELTTIDVDVRIHGKRTLSGDTIGRVSFVKPLSFDAKKDTKSSMSVDVIVQSNVFDDLLNMINNRIEFEEVSILVDGLDDQSGNFSEEICWNTKLAGHDLSVKDMFFGINENKDDKLMIEYYKDIIRSLEKINNRLEDGVKVKIF